MNLPPIKNINVTLDDKIKEKLGVKAQQTWSFTKSSFVTSLLAIWHSMVAFFKEWRPIVRGIDVIRKGIFNYIMMPKHRFNVEGIKNGEKQYQEFLILEDKKTVRSVQVILFSFIFFSLPVIAYIVFGWYVTVLMILVGIVTLDVIGHLFKPVAKFPGISEEPDAIPFALSNGDATWKQIEASIKAAFIKNGYNKDDIVATVPLRYDNKTEQYTMTVSSEKEIKASFSDTLERSLGAPKESITLYDNPDIASQKRIVVQWGDPLVNIDMMPHYSPNSQTVEKPWIAGKYVDGEDVPILLSGTHIFTMGLTGAGKTTYFGRGLLNYLTACSDAVVSGIDLQGSQELKLWEPLLQSHATNAEQAKLLLDNAISIMNERSSELDQKIESGEFGNHSEWTAKMGPLYFIFIDEFHAIVSADTVEKSELLTDIKAIIKAGRKYGVHIIAIGHHMSNEDFGATTIVKNALTKVIMATTKTDANAVFSAELVSEGWRPHRFLSGNRLNPGDAGKAFVQSPDLTEPKVARFFKPMPNDAIATIAQERKETRPQIIQKEIVVSDKEGKLQEIVDIMEALAVDEITSEDLVSELNLDNTSELGSLTKNLGVERTKSGKVFKGTKRGYTLQQFKDAQIKIQKNRETKGIRHGGKIIKNED